MNNHRFYNTKYGKYTTSYEVGKESFESAWLDQRDEVGGEKNFDKYLPDFDTVVAQGNELCNEEYFMDDWVREEY